MSNETGNPINNNTNNDNNSFKSDEEEEHEDPILEILRSQPD